MKLMFWRKVRREIGVALTATVGSYRARYSTLEEYFRIHVEEKGVGWHGKLYIKKVSDLRALRDTCSQLIDAIEAEQGKLTEEERRTVA